MISLMTPWWPCRATLAGLGLPAADPSSGVGPEKAAGACRFGAVGYGREQVDRQCVECLAPGEAPSLSPSITPGSRAEPRS
jgi:hypothetical protein